MRVEERQNSNLVLQLYQKQQKMDDDFNKLRIDLYETLEKFREEIESSSQREKIDELMHRISMAEGEIRETKQSLELISNSMTTMTQNVQSIHTDIVEIKNNQSAENNLLYQSQDKFIRNLWKAFFAILGILTGIGGTVVTLLQYLR